MDYDYEKYARDLAIKNSIQYTVHLRPNYSPSNTPSFNRILFLIIAPTLLHPEFGMLLCDLKAMFHGAHFTIFTNIEENRDIAGYIKRAVTHVRCLRSPPLATPRDLQEAALKHLKTTLRSTAFTWDAIAFLDNCGRFELPRPQDLIWPLQQWWARRDLFALTVCPSEPSLDHYTGDCRNVDQLKLDLNTDDQFSLVDSAHYGLTFQKQELPFPTELGTIGGSIFRSLNKKISDSLEATASMAISHRMKIDVPSVPLPEQTSVDGGLILKPGTVVKL